MHDLDKAYIGKSTPDLQTKAVELVNYMRGLSNEQIMSIMKIKAPLAETVAQTYADWNDNESSQRSAIHSFAGDIYSGLQVHEWTEADLDFAQKHLRILSGLYGVLRPLDGIRPYRLELGYKLFDEPYRNLYKFWSDRAAAALHDDDTVVDLTAKEYGDLVMPYITDRQIIRPKFLTVSTKTGEPTFVVVHAKIARGAFAAWLIKNRVSKVDVLPDFAELGYKYDSSLSTDLEPVYVCEQFGGIGLSVRLQHK